NITLPTPNTPVANYVGAVRAGNLLFVSGHGPLRTDGKPAVRGKVGRELSVEQGYQVAREVGLNLLATTRASLGSLDKVKRVVKVLGMVNSADGFGDQPKVINGFAVPVALIGLLEGWRAGLLAAILPAAYRVWLGGPGAPAGVLGVVGAALIAGGVHAWARRHGGLGPRHAFAVAGLVFAWTFTTFALVGPYARELFGRVWLPVLVAHVVGVGFTARLLYDVQEQARLSAERARFRAILDEASDAIRIVDADTFEIIDINRRDCHLSGYHREELVGHDSRKFWPQDPEERSRHDASAAEARARGIARTFSLPYRTRTGDTISVDSTRRVVEHQGRRYEIIMF